jgi:hypothetical protein
MTFSKYAAVIGIWLLCSVKVYATVTADDTTYIKTLERKYSVQFNTWLTDIDLLVLPRKQERDLAIRLQPNVKGQAGLAVGFKYFTLAFGVQVPGTESDERKRGKTNYYDFSFGYFKRKFGGEIYYRYFKGMLRERNDFTEDFIRPDIYLSTGGLNFFYASNHKKFSMRSAISQQEIQVKSAGSFVLLFNSQFRNLLADSSIIPTLIDRDVYFGELQGLSEMRFITASIRPGYAYNFVAKDGRWFISPAAFAGVGSGWYTSQSRVGYKTGLPLDVTFHAKAFAGYNHTKWFLSVFYTYDGNLNVFKNSLVNMNTHCVGLNVGYRLHHVGVKWL